MDLFDRPSCVRRSTYDRVRGSLLIRTIAIVQSALFAVRSPPLFKRCRIVLPDDACKGLAPHSAARAASLFRRSGLSPATATRIAAVCGPTPNCSRRRRAWRRVNCSSMSSRDLSSSQSICQRLARRRNVVAKVCKCSLVPSERNRAHPSAHSAGLHFHRRSRTSCGALTSKARSWLIACVLAFTALRLATDTARIASAAPDCIFGIAFAVPDRTAYSGEGDR